MTKSKHWLLTFIELKLQLTKGDDGRHVHLQDLIMKLIRIQALWMHRGSSYIETKYWREYNYYKHTNIFLQTQTSFIKMLFSN